MSVNKKNLIGFCFKMFRIGYLSTGGAGSSPLLVKWQKEGIVSNGKCTTPKTMDSHKTGSVSTLLDILEKQVEESYFLSQEKTMQLLSRL